MGGAAQTRLKNMCALAKLETCSPNKVFAHFQRALFHKERKQVFEIILKPVCLSV
jgi:hypothetical protein